MRTHRLLLGFVLALTPCAAAISACGSDEDVPPAAGDDAGGDAARRRDGTSPAPDAAPEDDAAFVDSPAEARPADASDASDGGTDASDGGADASEGGVDASDGGVDASEGGVDASEGGVDASDGGVDASDGGVDASDGGAVCAEPGFSPTATAFSLPTSPYAYGFPQLDFQSTCATADGYSWSTFDLDGDGLPDLVGTRRCGEPAVGNTEWRVHKNTGAGFASAATPWSLPSFKYGLPQLDFKSACSTADGYSWSTFDATGDGRPDLVVTALCSGGVVGNTQWSVYANTGSGFASAATPWSLPSFKFGFPQRDFVSACSTAEGYSWSTFDVTGDKIPDLVVTAACSGGVVGKTQWSVYAGSASGFASSASLHALPVAPYKFGFSQTEFSAACSTADGYSWSTFDVNADGRPDLVVTNLCQGGIVGRTQWDVHVNTGSGFAASPTAWALPAAPFKFGFGQASFTTTCTSLDYYSWSTFDATGDGRPDLVVTDRCGATTTGRAQWDVYTAGAAGFAQSPSCFPLPVTGYSFGFPVRDFLSACSTSAGYSWTVLDMNGDKKPDLVTTLRCGDVSVGKAQWSLHGNGR